MIDWAAFQRAFDRGDFWSLDKVKVKLVDQCNLRCLKCKHWDPARRASPDQANPLTADEWDDLCGQLIGLGLKKAAFTGGEPTLHPALPRIVGRLTQGGVRCSLTTNGTLLAGGLARSLIQAGLAQIRFSVDGPTPQEHDRSVGVAGSFARLEAGLDEIRSTAAETGRDLVIKLNTVVSDLNHGRLADIIDWAGAHGVSEMLLMGLNQDHLPEDRRQTLAGGGRGLAEHLKADLPELKALAAHKGIELIPLEFRVAGDGSLTEYGPRDHNLPCLLAWTTAAIYPAGDVYVCCHSRHPSLHFGNVRNRPLATLLQGETGRRVRTVCQAPDRRVADCRDCDLYPDRFDAHQTFQNGLNSKT